MKLKINCTRFNSEKHTPNTEIDGFQFNVVINGHLYHAPVVFYPDEINGLSFKHKMDHITNAIDASLDTLSKSIEGEE